MVETPASVRRPAPLACDACRRKHLKCDAAAPVCGRCSTNALSCTYTASRRGLGRRSRRIAPTGDVASTSSALPSPAHSHASASRSYADDAGHARTHADAAAGVGADTTQASEGLVSDNALQSLDSQEMTLQAFASPTPHLWSLSPADRERLLGLFYLHLFGALS